MRMRKVLKYRTTARNGYQQQMLTYGSPEYMAGK
nr:MAG TPA: hypothetical protein [Caudoviricetes sp.]